MLIRNHLIFQYLHSLKLMSVLIKLLTQPLYPQKVLLIYRNLKSVHLWKLGISMD